MNKKAFTLLEILIVIILVSIIYSITLSNFNLKQKKLDTVTLSNLKQLLSSFEYNEKINIKCINNKNIECLLFIDEKLQEEKITNLFKSCPDVYKYSKNQDRLEFDDFEFEDLSVVQVCFEFDLYKNGKSSQMIVDTGKNTYIFDNISQKPKKIKYINDIGFYFNKKDNEVKNAF